METKMNTLYLTVGVPYMDCVSDDRDSTKDIELAVQIQVGLNQWLNGNLTIHLYGDKKVMRREIIRLMKTKKGY